METDYVVGGVLELQVNGGILDTTGDFTWNTGGWRLEEVVINGAVITKQIYVAAFIEGEYVLTNGINPDDINGKRGITASLTIGDGRSLIIRNASIVSDGTINTASGNGAIRIVGQKGVFD